MKFFAVHDETWKGIIVHYKMEHASFGLQKGLFNLIPFKVKVQHSTYIAWVACILISLFNIYMSAQHNSELSGIFEASVSFMLKALWKSLCIPAFCSLLSCKATHKMCFTASGSAVIILKAWLNDVIMRFRWNWVSVGFYLLCTSLWRIAVFRLPLYHQNLM